MAESARAASKHQGMRFTKYVHSPLHHFRNSLQAPWRAGTTAHWRRPQEDLPKHTRRCHPVRIAMLSNPDYRWFRSRERAGSVTWRAPARQGWRGRRRRSPRAPPRAAAGRARPSPSSNQGESPCCRRKRSWRDKARNPDKAETATSEGKESVESCCDDLMHTRCREVVLILDRSRC